MCKIKFSQKSLSKKLLAYFSTQTFNTVNPNTMQYTFRNNNQKSNKKEVNPNALSERASNDFILFLFHTLQLSKFQKLNNLTRQYRTFYHLKSQSLQYVPIQKSEPFSINKIKTSTFSWFIYFHYSVIVNKQKFLTSGNSHAAKNKKKRFSLN